jgi:hypothetical protein
MRAMIAHRRIALVMMSDGMHINMVIDNDYKRQQPKFEFKRRPPKIQTSLCF